MNSPSSVRIAWLSPSLALGFYWQPVLSEFSRLYPQTTVFTGDWPGFIADFESRLVVKVVGKTKIVETMRPSLGYSRGFMYASPSIIGHLLRFQPHVIITSAFSIWTVLTLLLKVWGRWRVIIGYEGSSPNVDYKGSLIRLFTRRAMARFADAFITNTQGGEAYLTKNIRAEASRVFTRPIQVPSAKTLSKHPAEPKLSFSQLQHPIFLFVGQIIPRKGLHLLLEACSLLRKEGCCKWSLLIVGDGPDRCMLQEFIKSRGLEHHVKWAGWMNYDHLGAYFQASEVMVFPTLEDTWGMVVLEAMAFGMPILCSKWAGAAEMVVDGDNGYIFDPHHPEQVAALMRQFIDNSRMISSMGERSKQIVASHTPEAAAKYLAEVVAFVLDEQGKCNVRIDS